MSESKHAGPLFVVFDGPPEHEAGRFVEVEDANGNSVSAGTWTQGAGGYWALGPFVTHAEHEGMRAQRDALREAARLALDHTNDPHADPKRQWPAAEAALRAAIAKATP